MKVKVLTIVALLISTISFAQGGKYGATDKDSVNCVRSLSLYAEFAKQKNYDDAVEGWRYVYANCPASSKNIYLNGVNIYRYLIKKETDATKREGLIDTLFAIYDNRIKHFGQKAFVLGRKGGDMMRFRPADQQAAYDVLKEAIDLGQDKAEANTFSFYYQAMYNLYAAGTVEKSVLLEEYLPVTDIITAAMVRSESSKNKDRLIEGYSKAKSNIDEVFIQIGQCEDIVDVFQKKIDGNPDDLDLIMKTLRILNKRECTENSLYKNVAEKAHKANPTAGTAFAIGMTNYGDRNYSNALTYFKQAMELGGSTDPDRLAYALGAAQTALKQGSMQSAEGYARKALAIDSRSGKAYLIIAQAIAGSKCGTNLTDIKYVYYLAYDYAEKAKSVDSSVSSAASKQMSAYKGLFLTQTEKFTGNLENGQEVKVGCWVNETTKVR